MVHVTMIGLFILLSPSAIFKISNFAVLVTNQWILEKVVIS